jgi:hypothetical protein
MMITLLEDIKLVIKICHGSRFWLLEKDYRKGKWYLLSCMPLIFSCNNDVGLKCNVGQCSYASIDALFWSSNTTILLRFNSKERISRMKKFTLTQKYTVRHIDCSLLCDSVLFLKRFFCFKFTVKILITFYKTSREIHFFLNIKFCSLNP